MNEKAKQKILAAFKQAQEKLEAKAKPIYDEIHGFKGQGSSEEILERLKELGWSGVCDGMEGVHYPPSCSQWAHVVKDFPDEDGNSGEHIQHPLDVKTDKIEDHNISCAAAGLGRMTQHFERIKSQLRFYKLIGGDPNLLGDWAWCIYYQWVERDAHYFIAKSLRDRGDEGRATAIESLQKYRDLVCDELVDLMCLKLHLEDIKEGNDSGPAKWKLFV